MKFRAELLEDKLDPSMMTYAAVQNVEVPNVWIVCRQLDNPNAADDWEPLYFLKDGDECDLPSCFKLHERALDALDDLTQDATA
jgi:hypothetical protein